MYTIVLMMKYIHMWGLMDIIFTVEVFTVSPKTWLDQWPFQDPKMEVPTIYKAYVREYPWKIWPYMVQYLHFRILEFPLTRCYLENHDKPVDLVPKSVELL